LLKVAVWLESTAPNPAKQGLKYWCHSGNENWFKNDLKKKNITAFGVKQIGLVQGNFKAYYLSGAVAPKTGASFWWEFSHLDSRCFEIFLDKLAAISR